MCKYSRNGYIKHSPQYHGQFHWSQYMQFSAQAHIESSEISKQKCSKNHEKIPCVDTVSHFANQSTCQRMQLRNPEMSWIQIDNFCADGRSPKPQQLFQHQQLSIGRSRLQGHPLKCRRSQKQEAYETQLKPCSSDSRNFHQPQLVKHATPMLAFPKANKILCRNFFRPSLHQVLMTSNIPEVINSRIQVKRC